MFHSFPGKYLHLPATAVACIPNPAVRLQHHLQDGTRLPTLVPCPASTGTTTSTATTAATINKPKFIDPMTSFHQGTAYRYHPFNNNAKMHQFIQHNQTIANGQHTYHNHLQHSGTSLQDTAGFHLLGFDFTGEDLDMVLYGYAKGKENDPSLGLALSGLRIGELSYGKNAIFVYLIFYIIKYYHLFYGYHYHFYDTFESYN